MKKVYQEISARLQAIENCKRTNNQEWQKKHQETIKKIIAEFLPSGSGIDSGVALNFEKSTSEKLVFDSSYHNMENGFYNSWIDFSITVKPSLAFNIDLSIKGNFGKKYQDLKNYLGELFYDHLMQSITIRD